MTDHKDALQSFEEIFHHNYRRFCQRVFRITNDLEAAEDIVQEVFISYWNRSQNHPIETPEAYRPSFCKPPVYWR